MITFYQTDPGKVRSHNEDSVTIVKNNNDEYLVVVADGMGGHKAGEVASSLVVNELSNKTLNAMKKLNSKNLVVAGGVSANSFLKKELTYGFSIHKSKCFHLHPLF